MRRITLIALTVLVSFASLSHGPLTFQADHAAAAATVFRDSGPSISTSRAASKNIKSGANGTSAPSLYTYRNIVYATTDGASLLMDIDQPRNQGPMPAGGWPVILSLHAGGYLSGNRSVTEGTRLVYRGYAIARIDYRLSGTWKFPAQIYDVKAAVRFLRQQAGVYRINPDKIGVIGYSAGGHLAALLGLSCGVPYLEGTVGDALSFSSCVKAVVDVSGPSDFMKLNEHQNPMCPGYPHDFTNGQTFYSKLFVNGRSFMEVPYFVHRSNPAAHITPDDPPVLIVHGLDDCQVPFRQSQYLHEALLARGVESTLIPMQGLGHGIVLYNCPEVWKQVVGFFDRHLKGNDE